MSSHRPEPLIYHEIPFALMSSVDPMSCAEAVSLRAGPTDIHLLGAPKDVAAQVFSSLARKLYLLDTKLIWWPQNFTKFNSQSAEASAIAQFDPQQGFHKVELKENCALYPVFILYYSDGHDPALQLNAIFESDVIYTHSRNMIIPVAEYVFDYDSSYNILASERAPLLRVETKGLVYCAPYTLRHLEDIHIYELRRDPGTKSTLGALDSRLK